MTQFYNIKVPAGKAEPSAIVFSRPVRKISVNSTGFAHLTLKFSDGTHSPIWLLAANETTLIDFQSANNGGGVPAIYFNSDANKDYYVAVSVVEYGTGGNIDWYK